MAKSKAVAKKDRDLLVGKLLGFAVLTIVGSSAALADKVTGPRTHGHYAYADVTHVRPIVRVVNVTTPREVCWNATVARGTHPSETPTIIGGILGGVAGNQFGGGRGRSAMTIAGALLGASIGHDATRHRAKSGYRTYAVERRCEIEQISYQEERIDGYKVGYRYQGHNYVTQMRNAPGDSIRVRVSVGPASGRITSRRGAERFSPFDGRLAKVGGVASTERHGHGGRRRH